MPSPQVAGTSVTWRATPLGGIAPYHYQWSLSAAGQETKFAWGAASTWLWTPSAPGDYQVKVAVRSFGSTNTVGELTQTMPFKVTAKPFTVTLQPSLPAPQTVGSTIIWSASVSGGTGYQYLWCVFNGSVWSPATSWTTSSTWLWTPKVAFGGYAIAVLVRKAGSTTGDPEGSAMVPFPIK